MKNVIVFDIGGVPYAVELRWVREAITLGFVTQVPGAPRMIAGVVNLRGGITPVLDLRAILHGDAIAGPPARQGDGAVLVEVEGVAAALRVDRVDAVSTLRSGSDDRTVVDPHGRPVPLIDPPVILRQAMAATQSIKELAPALAGTHGLR